jgi:flagellar hook assembly protein FlgD
MIAAVGCATKPAVTNKEAAASTVVASAAGLAPSGDAQFKTIAFAISIGNPEAVKSWTFKIGDQKTVVKTVSGTASDLPTSMTWDGKNDSGAMAPEGTYTAMLAIDYGDKYNAGQAASKSFILDINPPTGSFSPNPAYFTYAPEGVKEPISVNVTVTPALAKVASWNIVVTDPSGATVKTLSAAWPLTQVGWDGKLDSGDMVAKGVTYPATLTIKDEFGNAGTFQGSFAIGNMPGAENSSISTRRPGFSPTSVTVKNTLDILTSVGSKASVSDWKVTIVSVANGSVVKTFSGGASDVPDSLTWDGKDASGTVLPEGQYYADLAVNYGKSFMPSEVKSSTFWLVTTPPTGSVMVEPGTVSLAMVGAKNPVTFTVQATSKYASIASWTLSVLDPQNTSVAIFQANWPNKVATWDGKTVEGANMVAGATYTAAAKVQDVYGNVGDLRGTFTVSGLPVAPEASTVTASSAGLAPSGVDKSQNTINFALVVGNKATASDWKLDIVSADSVVAKSFSGTASSIPDSVTWDGKGDDGNLAAESTYSAFLTVDYGSTYAPTRVQSKAFVLDITPPTGNIALSTKLFAPDGQSEGPNGTETITLTGSSKLAALSSWSLDILDPANNNFISFNGNWPAAPIAWDGKGANGDLVESASDYPVVAKLQDQFGNVGIVKSVISTDILVTKVADGYKIRVSSIVFKPYTADYRDVPADRAARNIATLDLLASKLSRFPDYNIRLEGHAVMIYWDNKVKGAEEQKYVLIPLSEERAKAIKAALVRRGIAADRLSTVGLGALDPVVPNSDLAERWKNRRVEFYMMK